MITNDKQDVIANSKNVNIVIPISTDGNFIFEVLGTEKNSMKIGLPTIKENEDIKQLFNEINYTYDLLLDLGTRNDIQNNSINSISNYLALGCKKTSKNNNTIEISYENAKELVASGKLIYNDPYIQEILNINKDFQKIK